MEDNFYVGDIFHSKKRNSKIEKAVLYSKDRVVYIDLLNEILQIQMKMTM